VRLMGLENSKAVHRIRVLDEDNQAKITYIGWSRNLTRKLRLSTSDMLNSAWKEAHIIRTDGDRKEAFPDLPHELTFLEVEASLPKISPLPVSGGSGYVVPNAPNHTILVTETPLPGKMSLYSPRELPSNLCSSP